MKLTVPLLEIEDFDVTTTASRSAKRAANSENPTLSHRDQRPKLRLELDLKNLNAEERRRNLCG